MTTKTEEISNQIKTKWRSINKGIDAFIAHLGEYPNSKFSEDQLVSDAEAIGDDMKRFLQLLNLGQEITIEKKDIYRMRIRVDRQKSIYSGITDKE